MSLTELIGVIFRSKTGRIGNVLHALTNDLVCAMPTQTLECQLAQAQMGRYLTGDRLSPEALTNLESHISQCADCQVKLSERRSTLESMLTAPPERRSSDSKLGPGSVRALVDAAVTSQQHSAPDETSPKAARDVSKPLHARAQKSLILAATLGAALIGMSYMVQSPSGPLGPKALGLYSANGSTQSGQPQSSDSANSTAKQAPASNSSPVSTLHPNGDSVDSVLATSEAAASYSPVLSDSEDTHLALIPVGTPVLRGDFMEAQMLGTAPSKPVSEPGPTLTQNTPPVASKPIVRRAKPHQPARRTPVHSNTATVRVYDASGKPIHK